MLKQAVDYADVIGYRLLKMFDNETVRQRSKRYDLSRLGFFIHCL